jgi:membrane AbrB-like protein
VPRVGERADRLTGWATVLLVTVLASLGFAALGLPSPVLFGALVGGMVQALAGRARLELPHRLGETGQALVGVAMGSLVEPGTFVALGEHWLPVVLVVVATLLLSVVTGLVLRVHGVSAVTGVFALVAGGASGLVAMAHELGADDRVVAVVQYLRVLVVLVTMPLVTTLVFAPPTSVGEDAGGGPGLPVDLLFTGVAVGVGSLLGGAVRLPAASLLGPLLVALALTGGGVTPDAGVPEPLQALAYGLVGVMVGLRFTAASLRSIARLLPTALALILGVVAGCAVLGLLLAHVTGETRLDAYLATTPGGLYAVLAMAADTGSNVTFVLSVQVLRLLVMTLAAPGLARLLRRS